MWIIMEQQRSADLEPVPNFEYNGNVWGPYDRPEDADKVVAKLKAETAEFYPKMEFEYSVKSLRREVQ